MVIVRVKHVVRPLLTGAERRRRRDAVTGEKLAFQGIPAGIEAFHPEMKTIHAHGTTLAVKSAGLHFCPVTVPNLLRTGHPCVILHEFAVVVEIFANKRRKTAGMAHAES